MNGNVGEEAMEEKTEKEEAIIDEKALVNENDLKQTENQDEETKQDNNQTKNSKKAILKNYAFNALYQIFLIIVPLIVTPYISRVLLPVGVGQYSFSYSLISYFVIFAALGFNLYGQREIAKYQGDKHKQSVVFWEITIVRIFTTLLFLMINIVLCGFNVYGTYNTLMLILSINIFATMFDFSFVLQGNEAFGKLVLRNFIVKTLAVISIFVFVKTENDVWIYTLINALMVLVSNLAIIFYMFKMVQKVSFDELKPFKRFVPALRFFLPTIVISIYTILDKTLIGFILKSDAQNGFYDQAYKIVSIVVTLTTALSLVMVSRNSYEKARGNTEALKNNMYFASKIVMCVGLPLMFGVMAISQNMNLWFFGPGYTEVINLMIAFAPLIMMIGLNNVTGIQYLMAVGRENTFTKTVIFGALLNFVLNIVLIYTIGTIGAVISSVVAEMAILVCQLIILRKEISVKKFLLCGWKNLLASVCMFVCLWFIKDYFVSSILNTCLLILIGMAIYGLLLILLKDDIIKVIKNKLFKKDKKI